MFIARRVSELCSVRKSGIRSKLGAIAMPLFRTEPEEDGLLTINIALLRSGTSHCSVRVLTLAIAIFARRYKSLVA